jgi:hypothetical protein
MDKYLEDKRALESHTISHLKGLLPSYGIKQSDIVGRGKNGNLLKSDIVDALLVAFNNEESDTSDDQKIGKCDTLCDGNKPSYMVITPCYKKGTLFENKKEVKDYCKSKVKGDYERQDRQKIADIHNMIYYGHISEEEGYRLLTKIRKT